jgi:hypothetical protein
MSPLIIQTLIRRDENHVLKSVSIQIIILTILTPPYSCYWIYIEFTFSQYRIKRNLIHKYEKFIFCIIRILLPIEIIEKYFFPRFFFLCF